MYFDGATGYGRSRKRVTKFTMCVGWHASSAAVLWNLFFVSFFLPWIVTVPGFPQRPKKERKKGGPRHTCTLKGTGVMFGTDFSQTYSNVNKLFLSKGMWTGQDIPMRGTGPGGVDPESRFSPRSTKTPSLTRCDMVTTVKKKMACGPLHHSVQIQIMTVSSVQRVTRTWTWVMMICRTANTLSLVLSISLFLSFALAFPCPKSSLFFSRSLSLFLTHTCTMRFFGVWEVCQQNMGYGVVDTSVLKTLFFGCVRQVYMYGNTHPLARSRVYPISNSHKNTIFLRIWNLVEKTPTIHGNAFSDALWHCQHTQKKLPAARASNNSARLPHKRDCSNPIHNHFLKSMFKTRSQLLKYCLLSMYWPRHVPTTWIADLPPRPTSPSQNRYGPVTSTFVVPIKSEEFVAKHRKSAGLPQGSCWQIFEGETFERKVRENRDIAAGWAVGVWAPRAWKWMWTPTANLETNTKHLQTAFAVTSIVLSLEQLGAKFLSVFLSFLGDEYPT